MLPRIMRVINRYSRKLRELVKQEDAFLLADIDFKHHTWGWQSLWFGFEDHCEVRGPRFMKLRTALKFSDLGYNIIVSNKKSLLQWFGRGTGKGIFHKGVVKKYFFSIMKPSKGISSVASGGFFSATSKEGMRLHRKRANRKEKDEIYTEFDYQCFLCKSKTKLTLHHILPRSFWGGTEKFNLVPFCQPCHTKVHKKKIDPGKLISLRYSHMVSHKKVLGRHRLNGP